MEQILHALASGTTVAELDLIDPAVATALSTLVMQASAPNDDPLMTTPRKLFTPPTASFIDATTASPSIRQYLTTAQESPGPTYCGALDFLDSQSKFDAGCGWPSFSAPTHGPAIKEEVDVSSGMRRTEVMCDDCGAHLGHVFPDGPPVTGLRYCINSVALDFKKA